MNTEHVQNYTTDNPKLKAALSQTTNDGGQKQQRIVCCFRVTFGLWSNAPSDETPGTETLPAQIMHLGLFLTMWK